MELSIYQHIDSAHWVRHTNIQLVHQAHARGSVVSVKMEFAASGVGV